MTRKEFEAELNKCYLHRQAIYAARFRVGLEATYLYHLSRCSDTECEGGWCSDCWHYPLFPHIKIEFDFPTVLAEVDAKIEELTNVASDEAWFADYCVDMCHEADFNEGLVVLCKQSSAALKEHLKNLN